MDTNELAKTVSEMLDVSVADAAKAMESMNTEQLINLESAVDAEDPDAVREVWDTVKAEEEEETPEDEPNDTREIKAEIQRQGKQLLEQGKTLDPVWRLIARLEANDWRLMWPSIDQEILIALLSEATDEEADSVKGADAPKIYNYAKELVKEHVVYQGEIVEVTLPRGPQGTVGVRTSKGLRMVNRTDLKPLSEHVMGMTQMPALARVLELAGVEMTPVPPKVFPKAKIQAPRRDNPHHLIAIEDKVEEIRQALEDQDTEGAGLAADHLAHLAHRLRKHLREE